jgi:hypothetical protein
MSKLTIRRLKWLKSVDAETAYSWLFWHNWSFPSDPPAVFLLSEVLRKIERKRFPALRDIDWPTTTK